MVPLLDERLCWRALQTNPELFRRRGCQQPVKFRRVSDAELVRLAEDRCKERLRDTSTSRAASTISTVTVSVALTSRIRVIWVSKRTTSLRLQPVMRRISASTSGAESPRLGDNPVSLGHWLSKIPRSSSVGSGL